MFDIEVKGVGGSLYSVTAESEGEMLDRVRLHMNSEHVVEVRVTKSLENLLRPVGGI